MRPETKEKRVSRARRGYGSRGQASQQAQWAEHFPPSPPINVDPDSEE